MTIQVGHSTALHCNFSTSFSDPYIFWYQQHQNQPPQMLLWVSKYRTRGDSRRFSSTMSVETSQVILHVQDAELQDSAAYYCALSPHWCPQLAALHRNVVCALRLILFLPLLACSSEINLSSSGTWGLCAGLSLGAGLAEERRGEERRGEERRGEERRGEERRGEERRERRGEERRGEERRGEERRGEERRGEERRGEERRGEERRGEERRRKRRGEETEEERRGEERRGEERRGEERRGEERRRKRRRRRRDGRGEGGDETEEEKEETEEEETEEEETARPKQRTGAGGGQRGLVGGDPQTQFFSEVSATVGQHVVLPCQSTTEDSDSILNFFWYRQLPEETLTFLLEAFTASGNAKFRNGKFSMVVYKNKTAPLEIATASFEDTAIYYCALKHHIKLSPISARAKSVLPRTAPPAGMTGKDTQGCPGNSKYFLLTTSQLFGSELARAKPVPKK
ncbi:hypothetical protein Q9233_012296 [Columba guinea]|nr:hypothetical protein Q9233_012296 [Columba guinea]